ELRVSGETGVAQRDVLGHYDLDVLRRLLLVLRALTTVTYALYTRSPPARLMFPSVHLAWTVPFSAFGIFRFIWIASRKSDAESPTESMLRHPAFMTNLFLYGASVLALLYLAP